MTIGEVINILELAKGDMPVRFAFCGLSPTKVDSWRGIYNEASIGFDGSTVVMVREMLRDLEEAVGGKLFSGYKGGKYLYTIDTPLHVDDYGCSTDTIIESMEIKEYAVYINTRHES
jgi:hypothetical protein